MTNKFLYNQIFKVLNLKKSELKLLSVDKKEIITPTQVQTILMNL